MAKRKPCKPKPKGFSIISPLGFKILAEMTGRSLGAPSVEAGTLPVNLIFSPLPKPNPAQVLTPVHIK